MSNKNPQLSFIYTENYRNLQGQFNLSNLNIFIGSNGSGKSNLINCLKFLKDCITPVSDPSRGVSRFEDAVSKFGGTGILDKTIESPAILRLAYGFALPKSDHIPNGVVLDLGLLSVKSNNQITRIIEAFYLFDQCLKPLDSAIYLSHPEDFFYYLDSKNQKLLFTSINEDKNDFQSPDHSDKYESIFDRELYLTFSSQDLTKSSILDWQFYNANYMNLKAIREAEPKIGGRDIYLSSSGENLALVIENLINQDIDFEDRLNEVATAIIPQTRKVRAIRSGRLSLTVEWWVKGYKDPFYLDELSDGTVRILCWAVILNSPKLPSLIVIDEPELSLHVAWMGILAEWIKRASEETQIIITTHSPDLLDKFTDCLDNVLCFHKSDNQHYSLRALSKESLEDKLEEGWELGDLYRVGDPIVGGWPW